MKRGIVIGRFRHSRQGGWEGEINTLTIHRHIRLVPNDDRAGVNAPAFRVMLGWQHIGDAWEHETRKEPFRIFFRIRIEDPVCPLSALLFPETGADCAKLIMQDGNWAPSRLSAKEEPDD